MILRAQHSHSNKSHQNTREIFSEEYTNVRWGEQNLSEVSKKIQYAYELVVFWKKNLFMLPTVATAKKIHNRDNKSEESLEEQLIT